MIRRGFLGLVAGVALLATRRASAQEFPPYVIRIVGRAARVRLPGGGFAMLPAGAEIDALPPAYTPAALALDITPVDSDRVFRGGFES